MVALVLCARRADRPARGRYGPDRRGGADGGRGGVLAGAAAQGARARAGAVADLPRGGCHHSPCAAAGARERADVRPGPGASEQSQIGGNVATNAGGPHALKYGVTGAWVTGLEVVLAPGELVRIGGWARKDVAGYDLKSLLIGSEGTLGVITAVRLRLLPAPEASAALVVFLRDRARGVRRCSR